MKIKKQVSLNLWKQIPAGSKVPQEVNCVVEIPKGSSNKYEYSEEWGAFKLDRVLYEAVFFPTEYGIIPQSWNEKDQDPLDIMVLSTFATFPGCVIATRPIGVIRMTDTGEEDNKIVSVPADDPRFEEIRDIADLQPHTKKELTNFLENYVELEVKKKIKINGWSGREQAQKIIKEAVESYKEKFK